MLRYVRVPKQLLKPTERKKISKTNREEGNEIKICREVGRI
jgi:hypothetical protein